MKPAHQNSRCRPACHQSKPRTRRGTSLVEIMAGVAVLAVTTLAAMAMFPLSSYLRDRSSSNTRAAAIIQRKLDQVRSVKAESLTGNRLQSLGMVDATSLVAGGGNTYTFTEVDRLSNQLAGATGTLTLSNPASDLVEARVTLNWVGKRSRAYTATAVTYVASKSVWKE